MQRVLLAQVKGEAEQVRDALRQISALVREHMQRKPSQVSTSAETSSLPLLPLTVLRCPCAKTWLFFMRGWSYQGMHVLYLY